MQVYFFMFLLSFFRNLPYDNPAFIDLLKLTAGTTLWIGGLTAYMYKREQKLKAVRISS